MFTVKIYFLTKNLTASVPHICAISVGNWGSLPGVGRKKENFAEVFQGRRGSFEITEVFQQEFQE